MSREHDLLIESVTNLLRRSQQAGPATPGARDEPNQLWNELTDAGFLAIGVPEEAGGSGGDLIDAAIVVRQCAQFVGTAALPIGSNLLVAYWLREAVGFPVSFGPTAVATRSGLRIHQTPAGYVIDGVANRVMWAPQATSLLLVARDEHDVQHVVSLGPTTEWTGVSIDLDTGRTMLPLGVIRCAGVHLDISQVCVLPPELDTLLTLRLGLLATVQIAGLLDAVFTLSVGYAQAREQFGRPIIDFQMIKDRLAVLAGEVAVAGAAADAAVAFATKNATDVVALPLRAARLRTGYAATAAARLGHQIHGAIGMTAEYDLHRYTIALWHWRDAELSDVDREVELGRLLAARGADGLWPAVVGDSSQPSEQEPS